MAEVQAQLALSSPATWTRPKGKGSCGRDPAAGPGTCYHWWDGCPRPDQRGCYIAWLRAQRQETRNG